MREYLRKIGYSGGIFSWIVKNVFFMVAACGFIFAIIDFDSEDRIGRLSKDFVHALLWVMPGFGYILIILDMKKKLTNQK